MMRETGAPRGTYRGRNKISIRQTSDTILLLLYTIIFIESCSSSVPYNHRFVSYLMNVFRWRPRAEYIHFKYLGEYSELYYVPQEVD